MIKWCKKIAAYLIGKGRYWFIPSREDKNRVYLERYYLLKNRLFAEHVNIVLHKINESDCDPWLHDHPWSFMTIILSGGYWEHSIHGRTWRGPGSIIVHHAKQLHKLELDPIKSKGKETWTLFFMGPRQRKWGFATDKGWMPHDEYLENRDKN
jgi:hypothetical protein